MDRSTWRVARTWISHPVTCAAVLLLLVNDHALKAAYGTWWTGKLSDVAGLIVAPPLLAVGVACVGRAVRPGRLVGVPVLVVGVGFALVKATATGAWAATTAWSLVAGSSLVRQDPTDLLTLPALALALVAGRRSARCSPQPDPAASRRVPPRWLLVLPLAVLATVATSAAQVPSADSVKVVDGVAYLQGRDGWYRSADGLTWSAVDDDPARPGPTEGPPTEVFADPWSQDVPSDDVPSWAAATPGSPTDDGADGSADEAEEVVPVVACTPGGVCFRPAPLGIGVGRSDDGGRTWGEEWSVPAEDLRELDARNGDVGPLATRDVAVLPVPGGDRVLAANGGDGLAVRDVDGTWSRLDHVYEDPTAQAVPLPGEVGPRPVYPVPEGVVGGLAAMALVLLATGRSPARRGTPGATATAITAMCVAAFASCLAAVVRAETAAYPGHVGTPWYLVWLPPLVAGGAAAIAITGSVIAAAVSGRARAIGPALLAGVAAGVAWELLQARPVAVVLALIPTLLAAWAARAWVRRADPYDPDPYLPWGPLPG